VRVPTANSSLPSVDRLIGLLSVDLESDDVPLWEVVWTLNTLAPAASVDEKIRLARRVVARLMSRTELWRGEWPGGAVAPVTDSEMRALAHDDAPWHDPEHATLLVWLRDTRPVSPGKAD
jgi:hypothetical protein